MIASWLLRGLLTQPQDLLEEKCVGGEKSRKNSVQRVNKTAEKKDEERRQVFELSSGDEKAKCKMQF